MTRPREPLYQARRTVRPLSLTIHTKWEPGTMQDSNGEKTGSLAAATQRPSLKGAKSMRPRKQGITPAPSSDFAAQDTRNAPRSNAQRDGVTVHAAPDLAACHF